MVLGCGLPLLFIFFAPAFGIKGNLTLFTFIVIMFAVHLLMPMRHGGDSHGLTEDNLKGKEEEKEEHDQKQHPH
tara:strand:- start:13134 stop:13355 length:222 start_codon:yes stop_codon:yes gene_type:complete